MILALSKTPILTQRVTSFMNEDPSSMDLTYKCRSRIILER